MNAARTIMWAAFEKICPWDPVFPLILILCLLFATAGWAMDNL